MMREKRKELWGCANCDIAFNEHLLKCPQCGGLIVKAYEASDGIIVFKVK